MTALVRTGAPAGDDWIRRMFPVALGIMTAAVDLSGSYDDSSEGLTDAAALHASMAASALAYLGLYSAWGEGEVNHNPGHVACTGGGPCVDGASTARGAIASYATAADGVAAWAAWVQRVSARAWELLGTGAPGFAPWFDRAAGTDEALRPTADEMVAAFNRVAALVGVQPVGADERDAAANDWVEAARGESRGPSRGGGGGGGSPRPAPATSSSSAAGPFVLLALAWGAWWASK